MSSTSIPSFTRAGADAASGRQDLARDATAPAVAPKIRSACVKDAGQVASLWNRMIEDTLATFTSTPKTVDDLRALITARLSEGHGFLVATDPANPHAVLGFATYGQFRGGVGYARTLEHSVVMDPAAQGRGVGRALMRALCAQARAGGGHSLMAGVSAENPDGLRFHAAIGFTEVARLREVGFKRGRYLDLVLMQKML